MNRRKLITAVMGGKAAVVVPWYLAGGISIANCEAAWQGIGAATEAASKINLANPGVHNLVDGTGVPSFNTATGWLDDDRTKFFTTDLDPVTTGQAWSAFVRFSQSPYDEVELAAFGCAAFNLIPKLATAGYCSNGGFSDTPPITSGVYGFAGKAQFIDGIKQAKTIPTATTENAETVMLFRYSAINTFKGYIQAACVYNVTLTEAQALAVSEAMSLLP